MATPTSKPTAVPTQPKVLVGAGTGTGTGAGGKKYFGDLVSRTGKPEEFFKDTKKRMQNLSDLTDQTLASTVDDFGKIKNLDDLSKFVDKTSRQNFNKFYNALLKMKESGSPPTALEEYLREMQEKGIRASDELIGAAGDAAAVRAGALPDDELVGIVEKFCNIYPYESPGGWNIIGKTPIKLFNNKDSSKACLLSPGDTIKFKSISKKEYENYNNE